MREVADSFTAVIPDLIEEIAAQTAQLSSYRAFGEQQLRSAVGDNLHALSRDLAEEHPRHLGELWHDRGSKRAIDNFAIEDMLQSSYVHQGCANRRMVRELAGDMPLQQWWFTQTEAAFRAANRVLLRIYLSTREQVISNQQQIIRSLSTPLVPLFEGIVALPLVGNIDERRAQQIMEVLLEGISSHHADVIILDITGVPVVDTQVANYLLSAIRAAQLLGSRTIISGIGPEIAQTMVQLGVNLSSVITKSDLRNAITYALQLRGIVINTIS